MPEGLDSLGKNGMGIIGSGNPERGVERRAIDQSSGGFASIGLTVTSSTSD